MYICVFPLSERLHSDIRLVDTNIPLDGMMGLRVHREPGHHVSHAPSCNRATEIGHKVSEYILDRSFEKEVSACYELMKG